MANDLPPRPKPLAIIGASGKLGFATLNSLLQQNLFEPRDIVCTTSAHGSSAAQVQKLAALGVEIRHATFDNPATFERALHDVDKVFLVSSPRVPLDYGEPAKFKGRERDHILAIEAARRAGVRHVYYTSLAFGRPSKAGVMRAHIVTEEFLEQFEGLTHTIIREGLYNESWPLYLGHWKLGEDNRTEVKIAGDSRVSWTSIDDLGYANAKILAAPKEKYAGKKFYLSNTKDPRTLHDVAGLVSDALRRDVKVKIVDRPEHEAFYIKERQMDENHIKWWATTYDALRDEECLIKDDTFDKLLAEDGRTPITMEETVSLMLAVNK